MAAKAQARGEAAAARTRPGPIPVSQPRLAAFKAAAPWLRQIDEGVAAGEAGAVVAEFEERLCQHFGAPSGSVLACANATIGLTLALQAATEDAPGLCLTPAWTSPATAQAVLAAGLTPYLVDVDADSGALTPEIAGQALRGAPGPVRAVLPVAPFGRAPDPEAWDAFREETGVPVVLDAAGAFDSLEPGAAAAVVSLRAGKPLTAGEGGLIVGWDAGLIADLRRRANLGMGERLVAAALGTNGRMSELAAAYGLADLKLWRLRRAELAAVLGYYRAAFADLQVIRLPEGLGERYVASTCCIEGPEVSILAIEAALAKAGVTTRRWWGGGLRAHPAFADLAGGPTPVADALARRTLGLPCWPGMAPEALQAVATLVRQAVAAA